MKKGFKILFWVTITVVTVIILVVFIMLVVFAAEYQSILKAFQGAITSKYVCSSNPSNCEYVNYNPPLPTTFPSTFSKDIAMFSGQLVWNLEQQTNNGSLNVPSGLTVLGYLLTEEKGAPTFGVIYLDSVNKSIYITFRGTATKKEWSVSSQTIFNTGGYSNYTCPPTTAIHSGFLEVFDQILPQLMSIVGTYISSANFIVVTGHSLGGAIASLVAFYMSSDLTTKPVLAYTFGKPRVGNLDYQSCIDQHFEGTFWRMENQDDIVPQLPLSVTPNLQNFQSPWIYEHEGQAQNYSSNWKSLELNHYMHNYLNFVNSLR